MRNRSMMCGQDLQNTDSAQIRTHVVNRCGYLHMFAQRVHHMCTSITRPLQATNHIVAILVLDRIITCE